jgi:hypothetical protein|tara:strand:- start:121099 stop:121416 length:318 start_codon:yes stop_codon:yes gene_type:complete
MMVLKAIDGNKEKLEAIATLLISERLLANATIDAPAVFYEADTIGVPQKKQTHVLSGISKSLLFKTINDLLRSTYQDEMPLLYSEPIIMLDPEHTEQIIAKLVKT